LWDLRAGKELRRFEKDTTRVFAAAFSPDGRNCLAAAGNVLWLWDLETGEALQRTRVGGGTVALPIGSFQRQIGRRTLVACAPIQMQTIDRTAKSERQSFGSSQDSC
jgi:WD40 repeat protein